MPNNSLLSVDDISNKLNVSKPTIYRWLKNGKLVGQKIGGQWRFDPNMLTQFFSGEQELISNSKDDPFIFETAILPDWATAFISKWASLLKAYLNKLRPDHVIVNDRRGAKIWELIARDTEYKYAVNLWHSSAVDFMMFSELQNLFKNKIILLFDEMMQHGREMHNLRKKLLLFTSSVQSLVCIRRESHIESGELIEYEAMAFESLNDEDFADKAITISRLMDYFSPPLDVGHLVIRGKYIGSKDYSTLFEKLANWGIPFITRCPDNEHHFLTITLDRPQFLETERYEETEKYKLFWNGPCKIRFYINTQNNNCYLSFITFPEMIIEPSELLEVASQFYDSNEVHNSLHHYKKNRGVRYEKFYEEFCYNLSINLLDSFIECGVYNDIGLNIYKKFYTEDFNNLRALFGLKKAKIIETKINNILSKLSETIPLFKPTAKIPPPLLLRENHDLDDFDFEHHDIFQCRRQALDIIPQRFSSSGSLEEPARKLISYRNLINELRSFSESTIGKVVDYGLDWGIIKPITQRSEPFFENGIKKIKIERCFGRGEFGSWFETDRNIISHRDAITQKTLAMAPSALETFLKWYNMGAVTTTIFHKIFTNLQHDWSNNSEVLFLGWRPYTYGPIPIWPAVSGMGHYRDFKNTLLSLKSIEEEKNVKQKRVYMLYRPNKSKLQSWKTIYKKRMDVFTRVHISSLTRLYARIQETIRTEKLISPYSKKKVIKQDALIVLSAARNQKIAYICSHWEFMEWARTGEDKILPQLDYISYMNEKTDRYYLTPFFEKFLLSARLLHEKIEMYRNIGQLHRAIRALQDKEKIEIAEIVLDSVDSEPIFDEDGNYPMETLRWVSRVIFSYTFLLRQILCNFDLDIDTRLDIEKEGHNGIIYDAYTYLDELLSLMPELLSMEKDLKKCISFSKTQKYDGRIYKILSNAFYLIVKTIEMQKRIPDPQLGVNKRLKEESWEGTIRCLREIPIERAPYAIAIADIKNLVNLPNIASNLFEVDYDEALSGLLNYVKKATLTAVEKFNGVHFARLVNDNVFLYGRDPNIVLSCVKDLILNTTRQIEKSEKSLTYYGLMRVGIAWKEDSQGDAFKGIKPGLIALKIGDKSGLKPGSISITQEIFERLSEVNQAKFNISTDKTEQGTVYLTCVTF